MKSIYRSSRTFLLIACALCAWTPSDAVALRVVSYNILNYGGDTAREANYRTVLADLQPDLIVVQEMLSQTGVDRFRDEVLNHVDGPVGTYAAAPFVNGPDTDNALFYRTDALSYTGDHVVISTTLRNIDRWKMRLVGYTGAELYVYSVHLKASQGSTNEQRRLEEATEMRQNADALPAGTNFVCAGDYNIYTSSESAYQMLLSPGADSDGQAFDPIDAPGSWHNNGSFSWLHTQSPRTAQFGGGSNGGMDDRFDMILQSAGLDDDQQMSYVPGTYHAYGEDGLHFNLAIIDAPTIPEGAVIANALHLGSDHLPVSMDLQVPAVVSVASSLDFGSVIVGTASELDLAVSNSADLINFMFADGLSYDLTPSGDFQVGSGPFEAAAGAAANLHAVTMSTATRGVKSGDVNVTSDDVDTPSVLVAMGGTVLSHARPSVDAGTESTTTALDFGTHAEGEFQPLTASLHNFAFDSLQASLDVHAANFTGPDAARFSLTGAFVPSTVGGTPASYGVQVGPDLTGVLEGQVLTAGLVFSVRDDQAVAGATDLSDLTFQLTAQLGASGIPGDLNGDGIVTLLDFITFAGCFGESGGSAPPLGCSAAEFADSDMDDDDDVDLADFLTFVSNFTG